MTQLLPVLVLALALGVASSSEVSSKESDTRSLQFLGDKSSSGLSLWAEEFSEEGVRAHVAMNSWLEAFFAATPKGELAPLPPRQPRVRQTIPAPRLPYQEHETKCDPHIWKKWNESISCDDMLTSSALGGGAEAAAEAPGTAQSANKQRQAGISPSQRRYLIIAPVGSNFNASKWMTHPNFATYDILALYYGSSKDFSCPFCRAVIPGSGAKWGLLNTFMKKHEKLWAEMARQYEAVMVADGDVDFIDTCSLNRLFEVFSAYKLLMGQPSLCRQEYRSTWWEHLYRQPRSVLRYVSFVEVRF